MNIFFFSKNLNFKDKLKYYDTILGEEDSGSDDMAWESGVFELWISKKRIYRVKEEAKGNILKDLLYIYIYICLSFSLSVLFIYLLFHWPKKKKAKVVDQNSSKCKA